LESNRDTRIFSLKSSIHPGGVNSSSAALAIIVGEFQIRPQEPAAEKKLAAAATIVSAPAARA
jgi:hypothetical protein